MVAFLLLSAGVPAQQPAPAPAATPAPRAVGKPSPNLVAGFNLPNRVVVSDAVKPGERIQIAVLGMNGPISLAPLNPVFVREARLEIVR